jgi:hypothetical protein
MSLLDKFLRKKSDAAAQRPVRLSELETLMSNKIKKDFEMLKGPIKEGYENIQRAANCLQSQLKILDQATYPDRTFPGLISRSVVSRKNFVSKMSLLAEQMKKPSGSDMEDMFEFYDKTSRSIQKTNAETTKDYALLKLLFEKEGKEVVECFRQLTEAVKELGERTSGLRKVNEKAMKAKRYADDIAEITDETSRDEPAKLEILISEKESGVRRITKDISDLEGSKEWKDVSDMQKRGEDLKVKIAESERRFYERMDRLEIPLKRYKRVAESGILNDYIQKSFDSALSKDPSAEKITSILKDIKTLIADGKMDIKDKSKFLGIIDDEVKNNTIGKIMEEHSKASREEKDIKDAIQSKGTLSRRSMLQSEEDAIKKQIEVLKSDKANLGEKLRRLNAKRDQEIKELEELASEVLGEKMTLEVG